MCRMRRREHAILALAEKRRGPSDACPVPDGKSPDARGLFSGASRARTGDLLAASQTLSQLSYGPAAATARPIVAANSYSDAQWTPDFWLLRVGARRS